MKNPIEISEVNIIPIKPNEGHLGFCSFMIDKKFYVGSVAIFSTREGGIRLVYPKKGEIDCFHPIKQEVGQFITETVSNKFNNFLKLNENGKKENAQNYSNKTSTNY